MKKIAVQKGLSPVINYLTSEGYTVTEFDSKKKNAGNFLNKYDAVVLTGENENVMGVGDTITDTQIIDANGLTPEAVKNEIERIK